MQNPPATIWGQLNSWAQGFRPWQRYVLANAVRIGRLTDEQIGTCGASGQPEENEQAAAKDAVDGVFDVIGQALANGDEARISGFGTSHGPAPRAGPSRSNP